MILSRYMTFEHFVDLCSQGLYLPTANFFADPWEGLPKLCWDILAERQETEMCNKFIQDQIKMGNPSFNDQDLTSIPKMPSLENIKKAKSWIYVSCWHNSEEESMAMWKLYGNRGVCLEVNFEGLQSDFEQFYKDQGRSLVIIARPVEYNKPGERINNLSLAHFSFYDKDSSYANNFPHIAAMGGLFLKHNAFTFEKEFRIVCDTFFISASHGLIDNSREDEYRVKLSNKTVRKVKLFPGSSQEMLKLAGMVLRQHTYGCEVSRSAIDLSADY